MTFLIASITPVIIFLYLIFIRDANREPWQLLLKCFLGGFLAIVLTLLINVPLQGIIFDAPFQKAVFTAFGQAAIPEELSKWLILYWLVLKSPHFDEHYDGIQYAVFVSLGFALVENILYVAQGGLVVAFFRGVLAVPGHGFFAVMMGYFLSLARLGNPEQRVWNLLLSLLYPITFHGLYDFFLMYLNEKEDAGPLLSILLMISFTLVVIYLWRLGLRKIRLHLKKDNTPMT